MITPDKHTEVRYSIIYVSGIIMKEIQTNGIIGYDDLKTIIINKIGEKAKDNFSLSLSFLFLINKIKYNKELDSIILEAK